MRGEALSALSWWRNLLVTSKGGDSNDVGFQVALGLVSPTVYVCPGLTGPATVKVPVVVLCQEKVPANAGMNVIGEFAVSISTSSNGIVALGKLTTIRSLWVIFPEAGAMTISLDRCSRSALVVR